MQFSPEYFVFKMKTQQRRRRKKTRRRHNEVFMNSFFLFLILQLTIGYCRCVVCVTFMTTNECKNVCKVYKESQEKVNKQSVLFGMRFAYLKRKVKKMNCRIEQKRSTVQI